MFHGLPPPWQGFQEGGGEGGHAHITDLEQGQRRLICRRDPGGSGGGDKIPAKQEKQELRDDWNSPDGLSVSLTMSLSP